MGLTSHLQHPWEEPVQPQHHSQGLSRKGEGEPGLQTLFLTGPTRPREAPIQSASLSAAGEGGRLQLQEGGEKEELLMRLTAMKPPWHSSS